MIIENTTIEQKKWQSVIARIILEVLDLWSFFIMALGIVLCIRFFIFSPFSVVGISMEPTFQSNDFVIIDKISSQKTKLEDRISNESWWSIYSLALWAIHILPELKRGDVIVFVPPGKDIHYIKRIIWLPGETVKILSDNQVQICKTNTSDCFILDQSYLPKEYKTLPVCGTSEFIVEKWLFVMWDNREHSTDSRCCFTLWCYNEEVEWIKPYIVPFNYVIGKVRARVIPNFTRF